MPERLGFFLIFFPAFLFALSFHESAHGWVALHFGDDTAKRLGRITLNPIPHMDLVGTVLLPLFMFLTPGVRIPIGGWAKPVPINPANMKRPRQDTLWVALAGPLSNLFLAGLSALFLRGLLLGFPMMEGVLSQSPFLKSAVGIFYAVLEVSVWINLGLAFFNLIPLHPLDGGKVLAGLLPESLVPFYNRVAGYGLIIIFILFYLGAFRLLYVPVRYLAGILIPSS
jgi:Zn-dependent protease